MKHKSGYLVLSMLVISWVANLQASVASCSYDGSDCRDCILKQMRYDCPSCVTILRCMAKCLWGGTARSKCTNRCDCNDKFPKSLATD
ncbi:Plexin-B2 [Bienertia sinuspersici]